MQTITARPVSTHFVIMGVAGSGKTFIGQMLAAKLDADFIDGDDLHPQGNIDKMAQGIPLTDEDRAPWLQAVGETLHGHAQRLIVGCSALKRSYRDQIRAAAGRPVTFLYLDGSRALIAERMGKRERHFMPLSLLDSQFAALQVPEFDEDAITVSIDAEPVAVVDALVKAIEGGAEPAVA
ncbi:gluconokinase [Tianweitania sp.]|uniref:gluconokinase n=1 Tax=Tianweitania sp. TaxID=2021634 RepID=UPI00289F816A|nr:gluconokinase [Tianweitania sp.]